MELPWLESFAREPKTEKSAAEKEDPVGGEGKLKKLKIGRRLEPDATLPDSGLSISEQPGVGIRALSPGRPPRLPAAPR